ncbi:DUF2628 domain-containing protein [Periweissella beninensis]|uniref:DUF2628 domain-containing protein n=1 Tax=Periweissella beninensis TaxID=504936 RepID=A0ABT0VGR5_9LACO|nr:DUF2628 domain-containing protein [Periweissella beninensis]MBM7544501.1 hypothetical protein [Periweissella beninensis]MCM2437024.1 DUF2628 domain-containing protein [Periweissella beninensis]MCT4395799.1 DUF2628 domain-containing protein [Periweissella beninensis]
MYITLKKDNNFENVKTGFSWTTMFFGFFPALLRGDFKNALIIFALQLIFALPTFGFGFSIVGFIFAIFYNRLYIKERLAQGWVVFH